MYLYAFDVNILKEPQILGLSATDFLSFYSRLYLSFYIEGLIFSSH